MRSAVLVLLSALFLLLAVPAQAGEWVEGDGFRLRLPPEFVDIRKANVEGQEKLEQALEMVDSFMPSDMGFDMKAFVRLAGAEPDAVIMAMAMHMPDEIREQMSDVSIDMLEQGMRKQQEAIERSGQLVEITRIRRILVSAGRPALELEINYDDPAAGPLNSLRMVFALEKGSIYMLGFQGMRRNASTDAILWRAIVTSFRLDERNSLLGMLMRYGPFILGGLVLLIALIFLRKSSSKQLVRPTLSTRPGGGDGGFSRALDGLPTYSQAGGDVAERSLDGLAAPHEPLPATPMAPPQGGPVKAPTIPRAAAAPEIPGAGSFAPTPERGAPDPQESAPSPTGGPTGLPRKMPQAQADAPLGVAPSAPPPPPLPPSPPPPPASPSTGPVPPPAVAERVEIEQLPAGSDMPTNVALRSAQEPVPQAADADEVLTRLMGLEEPPAGSAGEETSPAKDKKEGAKITRNSDFFG